MFSLSYAVSQGVLTAMPLLLLIPTGMTLFSVVTLKKLKKRTDEHFTIEDARKAEFAKEAEKEQELEDDLSYWSNNKANYL